jgi:DNA-binding LacI/PurR family transcriptional regulator
MPDKKHTVNLRTVAEKAGLAPCSVSAILNDTPAAKAIPQTTKDRVFRAAAELNYRPNLWARSLRTKRTRMVAAIAHDFGRGAVARVVAGVHSRLHKRGYLLALGTPDFEEANQISAQFQQRGIEGVIAIEATVPMQMDLPVASVEFAYVTSSEVLSEDEHAWLAKLGESAADTIIRQIEQENSSRRMKVDAKLPSAYFDLPSAVLATAAGAQESA